MTGNRVGEQEPKVICPRVMIAGTGSGVGKTSIALGLVRALKRRGLKVRPFKVGPDFLDPTHLTLAADQTCYNLDTWMCSTEYVENLMRETSDGCDIAVIEGVMGLFDGASFESNDGSAAHIAALLKVPVILVCDAHGQARSFAATVKGFAEFDSDVPVVGVIANRCGTERHATLLSRAMASAGLPPLLGGVLAGALPKLESRHLGLVRASSSKAVDHRLNALADAVESRISVEKVIELAAAAPQVDGSFEPRPKPDRSVSLRLGVALDSAFHFYYPDNLNALEQCGFELVSFSPLNDQALPEGLDALYIGGGYPELYAERLALNKPMLASMRAFCNGVRPVYAECGGLMYLCEAIVTLTGTSHSMVGVIPSESKMLGQIKNLGYSEVTLMRDALFGPKGTRIKGHEFHYSELTTVPQHPGWQPVYTVAPRRNPDTINAGYLRDNVLVSYVHLHLGSNLDCVAHFAAICLENRALPTPVLA